MTHPPRVRALLLAALVVLCAVAAVGDRFWLQLVGKALITCLFAIGLDLLVGFTGLVSLAHAAFSSRGPESSHFEQGPSLAPLPRFLHLHVPLSAYFSAQALNGNSV